MDFPSLLQYTFGKVVETFSHNWFLLLLSIIASAALKLYVDEDAVARFLRRNTKNSVLMSTGVAVATPLCSCGTTAIVLGMMASTIPWAPIVAFLVASPLTSPQELFYSAGLFGWDFAIAFFVASIVLGLAGGAIASFAESRGWLANQARMAAPKFAATSMGIMGGPVPLDLPVIMQPVAKTEKPTVTFQMFMQEMWTVSKRLLPLFLGFTFIGYMLNGMIPAAWITSLFGSGHVYSIPLAATLGLPFYINTEASLPLVRAMIDSGMSQGAALAFLITGAGTSLGALGGALTIARWRVIGIVVGTLWVGSIILGFAYNLFIM
ncbi:MAG TPA: permease [Anaerolineales bacterium]|nr:permease [Anaerolineales bacterium]HMV96395.1 permease [Anaerolineales bacterium]HMX18747.1 permease [Anaerolineales bacterium]HMX74772.1 permease [Anaerolineales bacterium]HMZ44016.1 permease [Anaerolineales bacterium]